MNSAAGSRVTHLVTLPPRRLRVTLNPYKEADTCDVTFDYARFPFDPRLARAVAVEAYLGNARSLDAPFEAKAEHRIFIGHADEGEWNIDRENSINIQCRDMTALLADATWDGSAIDNKKPLTDVVRAILDKQAATAPMQVEWRGSGDAPIPARDRAAGQGEQMTAEARESYWDVIVALAAESGVVAWVEFDTVVIAPAQNVRTDVDAPLFVYGKNLKSLKIKRGIGRGRSPRVIVRSWDSIQRKTLVAVYPEQTADDAAADAAGPLTGDGQARQEKVLTYTLSNIHSEEALKRAARNIWTRRAQEELALELETRDMASLDTNVPFTSLRSGMPLRVIVSEEEKQFLHRRSVDERRRYLMDRGYAPDVSAAIAEGYERIDNLLMIREAEHSIDREEGYRLTIRASNYITIPSEAA